MQIAIIVIEIIIILGTLFLFYYVKGLPDRLHKMNIKLFEHDLSKKLETFKASLIREIEMTKISETQLQIRKAEEFTKVTDFMFKFMYDKRYQKKMKDDPNKLNITMADISSKLFYFASDETLKKYVEWRQFGLKMQKETNGLKEPHRIVILFAELIVLMRKDLGYKNTKCNENDFLNIILTDWEEVRKKLKQEQVN